MTILILEHAKALGIGDSEKAVWKWLSAVTSIFVVLSTLSIQVWYLKHSFLRNKYIPQKNSSIDASPPKKKGQPTQKESTIEIKQGDKSKIDTEKENMIIKLESFKTIKVLYVLRNDLELLPLPGQPLKRFSSHNSNGNFKV